MKGLRLYALSGICLISTIGISTFAESKSDTDTCLGAIIEYDKADHSSSSTNYRYDKDGRVTEMKTDNCVTTIDWSGLKQKKVEMDFAYKEGERGTATFILDDKNHATSITLSDGLRAKVVGHSDYLYQITYTPDNKLQSVTETRIESIPNSTRKNYIPVSKLEFRINPSNNEYLLADMTCYDQDGTVVETDGYNYHLDPTMIDKCHLFAFMMPEESWDVLAKAYLAGLLGRATYYLPEVIEIKSIEKGEEPTNTVIPLIWKNNAEDLPASVDFSKGKDEGIVATFIWQHRMK